MANGVSGIEYLVSQAVMAGVAEAVGAAGGAAAGQLAAVADRLARGVTPSARVQAHREVGKLAQKAVLASYGQTVRQGAPPYRLHSRNPRNRRFADGALRKALAAPDFFEATADELQFINITRLNKEARQWARLNAGAGPAGLGSRRTFEVQFGDLAGAALGVNMDARDAFSLPPGYWFDRASGNEVPPGAPGTSEFYPVTTGPYRFRTGRTSRLTGEVRSPRGINPRTLRGSPTRGIRARNFLDAGVASIANNLPKKYEKLYADLWKEATGATVNADITVRPHARYRAGASGLT